MEQQKCYVFKPSSQEERPTKKRRISKANLPSLWSPREKIYRQLWAQQEKRIQDVLEQSNASTLDSIVSFVAEAALDRTQDGLESSEIPAGLIITGPSIASHAPFFEQLGRKIGASETKSRFVLLTANECPNLKTLLKTLIRKATSRTIEGDEDDLNDFIISATGPKMLDYDLAILQQWMSKQRLEQVVIAVQDSEAFDAILLSELIELLSSWSDRMGVILLFDIATSTESFQDRLPGSVLRYLKGKQFDATRAEEILEDVFWSMVDGPDVCLRLGPHLSHKIITNQKDYIQSVDVFSAALKYAYMSHFYANTLSIFMDPELEQPGVPTETFEALRNLPSFRRWAEELLNQGHAKKVRKLLDSDDYLLENVAAHMKSGLSVMSELATAVLVLFELRKCIPKMSSVQKSMLYAQAVSAELNASPTVREVLLSVKKASSDMMSTMLSELAKLELEGLPLDISAFQESLDGMVKSQANNAVPLRSEHDLGHGTLRTTVVAQKVELSKQKSALSKQDAAYSKLVDSFHAELERYFDNAFIRPQDLFMHEVFVYDLKSPHAEAFTPRPRYAIERALSSPHDYLNCACCAPENLDNDGTLSSTQPATAILYQLYLESGSLINVRDLFSAFNAILGDEEEENESATMALFQRALAELKYLGLVKASRKKTDHIAKVMWKGL